MESVLFTLDEVEGLRVDLGDYLVKQEVPFGEIVQIRGSVGLEQFLQEMVVQLILGHDC